MKIDKTKMNISFKVLKEVEKLLKDKDFNIQIGLKAYQNGREQGLALGCHTMKRYRYHWIAWAECRHSDSIMVFHSNQDPMQGLTEVAYNNGTAFDPGKYKETALYILNLIEILNKE